MVGPSSFLYEIRYNDGVITEYYVMGLFFTAPKKPASDTGGSFAKSSHHISRNELREQVRHDLHDRLGTSKGESVYNVLDAHLDRDRGSGSQGVSGRELDDMVTSLQHNHEDNLHERDIEHIREVLGKHLND